MAELIQREHQSIDRALLEVDALLDDHRFAHRLRTAVSSLANILQAHFEHEERSYLFLELPIDYPRFSRRIDALKVDHVEMLVEVRSIVEGLGELHPSVVALRLRALMTRLGFHEETENDLLQRAHTDDIPSMD